MRKYYITLSILSEVVTDTALYIFYQNKRRIMQIFNRYRKKNSQ